MGLFFLGLSATLTIDKNWSILLKYANWSSLVWNVHKLAWRCHVNGNALGAFSQSQSTFQNVMIHCHSCHSFGHILSCHSAVVHFFHFPQSCVAIKSSVLFPVIENSGWPPFTRKVLSEICKWFCQQFGFCICPRYFTWSFRSSELDCRFPAVSLFVVAALGLHWNQRICSS